MRGATLMAMKLRSQRLVPADARVAQRGPFFSREAQPVAMVKWTAKIWFKKAEQSGSGIQGTLMMMKDGLATSSSEKTAIV